MRPIRLSRTVRRLVLIVVGLVYCVAALWLAVVVTWYAEARRAEPIDVRVEPNAPIRHPDSTTRPRDREPPPGAFGASLGALTDLRKRDLLVPVRGAQPEDLTQSFHDKRGDRTHDAIDILASRRTPVLAVDDGRIEKLFFSKAGGHTIYQFDPTERYVYYYAHVEDYAEGLREGHIVRRGEVIAYVGTSGNAPVNTPHLHFAIFELGPEKQWWEGTPIDPFLVWRQ